MGFLDNAFDKAKEVFGVAKQKTTEVVVTEKQKYDISSIKSKREKDFAALGKICFETIKDNDDLTDEVQALIDGIKSKNTQIEKLQNDINTIKNKRVCPSCGALVSDESIYCSLCGAQLVFNGEE